MSARLVVCTPGYGGAAAADAHHEVHEERAVDAVFPGAPADAEQATLASSSRHLSQLLASLVEDGTEAR